MKTLITFFLILASCSVFAQEQISLNGMAWELNGKVVRENYKGIDCLKTDEGVAIAKEISLKNGVIEFKMCIQPGRGFAGVRFRGDGLGNTEEFYIRKHQSGNPDAMQYTPFITAMQAGNCITAKVTVQQNNMFSMSGLKLSWSFPVLAERFIFQIWKSPCW